MTTIDDRRLAELLDETSARIRRHLAGAEPPGPSEASRAAASAPADLARAIDHTLLAATATRADIESLCADARAHGFASVCVNGTWVAACRDLLRDSPVAVCTVVGFPLGAMAATAKAFEARESVARGAAEIDMALNLGALKSDDLETAYHDIRGVVEAAAPAIVKVILETSALADQEIVVACALASLAGAHFVKTATGFASGGATTQDVALMRRVVGDDLGVKASGGVRTADDARAMLDAGASRIGASASIAIVSGTNSGAGGY